MIVALAVILLGVVYFFWKYPALRRTWYWPVRRGFVALMYHHIGTTNPQDGQFSFTITPQMFEKQLLFLKQNGYEIASEHDILHARQSGHTHLSKPVLLTFDDGYADNYTALFPL